VNLMMYVLLVVAQVPTASSDEEPGGFLALARSERFVRPGVLAADEHDMRTAARRAPVLLGDLQEQCALVVVADRLAESAPETLIQLVAAFRSRIDLVGVVEDAEGRVRVERLLSNRGFPAESLRFIQTRTDSLWIRDFGPVFVESSTGGLSAFDFRYVRRSDAAVRQRDDDAGRPIAAHFPIPLTSDSSILEGGNLVSNGRGVLLTTTLALNANIVRGHESATVVQTLRHRLGCRTIVVLESLHGEPTGHVDMFACWTDPQTVVLASCEPAADPRNAGILDRNAKLLAEVVIDGKPLQVRRCPMPGHEDGLWRTYTNCIFVNGLAAIPRYRPADRVSGDRATALFRELMPGWSFVSIDAEPLAPLQGGLRCVSLPVPQATASPSTDPHSAVFPGSLPSSGGP
jgi:agmatine/peptidylarginine deiminase